MNLRQTKKTSLHIKVTIHFFHRSTCKELVHSKLEVLINSCFHGVAKVQLTRLHCITRTRREDKTSYTPPSPPTPNPLAPHPRVIAGSSVTVTAVVDKCFTSFEGHIKIGIFSTAISCSPLMMQCPFFLYFRR